MNYVGRGAQLSEDGRYRYSLTRIWSQALSGRLIVIGLNPSTADATQDDPTIRRCVRFAQREALGGLVMLNLFAFRATNPDDLAECCDPIGPDNDQRIWQTAMRYKVDGVILAAWGAHRSASALRVAQVCALVGQAGGRLRCLGVTKRGHPRHPLYVPAIAPIVGFPRTAA